MIKKRSCFTEKNFNYKFQKDRNLLIHEIINTRLLVFREKNNKEDLKKKKSFQLKYILIKTILIIGYRLINFTKKF